MCLKTPIHYHITSEWEKYTLLDFMRILKLPINYTKKNGEMIRFGHYVFLSSYLHKFENFYNHLHCKDCNRLMEPCEIGNFGEDAINQFKCINDYCKENEKIVYLNRCFNKKKCGQIIDSRDSKKCPNNMYICPDCGSCCSTDVFETRIHNLNSNGGHISRGIIDFVNHNLGHWEADRIFCYQCGLEMKNGVCSNCGLSYKISR